MDYFTKREWIAVLQDEAWMEDNTIHQQLCQGFTNTTRFYALSDVLRRFSYRAIH
jgi:hypothetical protein